MTGAYNCIQFLWGLHAFCTCKIQFWKRNFVELASCRGWANVGFHNPQKSPEVVTPNINQIASEGIVLSRAYAYRFCSPSRSSLNSGRLPVHVNTANARPDVTNPNDPVSGFAGIPRNMTGLGTVMLNGGYSTHQVLFEILVFSINFDHVAKLCFQYVHIYIYITRHLLSQLQRSENGMLVWLHLIILHLGEVTHLVLDTFIMTMIIGYDLSNS